ncbi:hypothetical protein ACP70R_042038 [Stipagrostis hirtigluma subsp. patula]
MASDSDDTTDADFFDKLVEDDDDDTHRLPLAAAAEASAGDLAALTLADQPDAGAPEPAAVPPPEAERKPAAAPLPVDPDPPAAHPEAEAEAEQQHAAPPPTAEPETAPAPPLAEAEAPEPDSAAAPETAESGSPGSGRAVQTAVKQAQWNDFGGADPFGDLLADGAEDAFLHGAVAGDLGVQAPVVASISAAGAADHSFSGGVDSNTNSQVDSGAGAAGYGDQSTNAQLDSSTDPRYWESLYPGWKYDEATQQWYQVEVDTLGVQQNAADDSGAAAGLVSDNVQQQCLENSSHAAPQTITEEGSTNATNWGQDASVAASPTGYPANMLFYAEYPGWYYDTNTRQWHSLESYQQTVAQTAATAAASDGFAGTGHSAVAHNEASYASSYSQQNPWQPGLLGNNMQPDGLADDSLSGSSYGFHQQAETQIGQQVGSELLQESTNYQPNIKMFVPSTVQYTGSEAEKSSYEGFRPPNTEQTSTSDQTTTIGHQSRYMGLEHYTGHQGGYQGFKPFTTNQTWYEGFKHSTAQEVGYNGHELSAGDQAGHTGFDLSKDHQASHLAYGPPTSHGYGTLNGAANSLDFIPKENMHKTKTHADSTAHMHLPNNYWGPQNTMDFPQQQLIGPSGASQQVGFSPHEQRSSAGRPPHALVTFGFGGKLIVLKETSSMTASFDSGNQGDSGHTVSVLNISEMVADKIDHACVPNGSALSYFHALCRRPLPGPLVGGSAAAKDVNKWLDEMIGGYESSEREFQGGDVQKLLVSLLKILCQHYGKLRSPFGSDPSQEGIDGPEMAVTKLFSSYKSIANMSGYGVVNCVKNIPLESQIQVTAQEVQNLLVSGRRKEALQYAQEGQLWGPALILALQLGDKFYADTVKKMAHSHFASGSPLRTLCLLIAGQPADVFNFENPVDGGSFHTPHKSVEAAPKGTLDYWQENLAIITANRTKGDDLVITHLGDCLWKEKNEVASAHSCYLVAELNVDSYSESARMCLIGADHLRCPRTFTSPEAIQRTEVYEYAKVLGNSQHILLSFQPYKLIYAFMLVEVGKVSDSLRYCQAALKVLKASGRTPELEAWKHLFSSLEERLRTHQQGGYTTNLVPAKIVGKLFTSLDKSLSRMMGTQPAPLAQLPQGVANERHIYSPPPPDTKVVNSQPGMTMSTLMSSASEQSMSEMTGNSSQDKNVAHNRSISEPDFGRTPQPGTGSGNAKSTSASGSSRLGWLVQKTVGLVSRSHRQAKLGEQNKFYYDEKLKRWVEEGAEIPAEEPPLPPPPTKASLQTNIPDYNMNGPVGGGYTANGFAETKSSNPSEPGPGMPPMPPTQNQFSARGRMGVRSRYVDTFNKGGGANAFGAATSYIKPAAPSATTLSGAKFFVPTPAVVASEQTGDSEVEAHNESAQHDQSSLASTALEAAFSSPPPPVPMQSNIHRYPSMDNIMTPSDSASSSLSRSRPASWSGTYPDQLSSTAISRSPDGQTTQSSLMPGARTLHSRSSSNSSVHFSGLGEDLQEVDL